MKKNVLLKSVMTIALVTPLVSGCSKGLDIKKDMSVELGTPISTNIKDYLNEDAKDQDKIIQEGKLSITEDKKVEGKDYQPVGDYIVKITYDGKEAEVKVSVKDTVKPVFKDFKNTIDTYKDIKVDFAKVFVTEDLSKVTITGDDAQVDYSKEGSYKATVTATDEGQNVETKEVTINVKKPEIKLDKTSQTLYEKESFVLKPEVKGKDTKATFKSSNTSIVEVSETGKVTAKKKGSATVTVSANGVEATCKVTVKSVPKGSSTTTQTIKNPTTGKNETVTVVKPSKPSKPSRPSGSGTTNLSAQTSREAFNLINAERRKRGLPEAVWDSECERIALLRAKEVHSEANPHDGFYKYQNQNRKLAEVLTRQFGGYYPPSEAVKEWMNSTAHRNILMSENRTKLAVVKVGNIYIGINSR